MAVKNFALTTTANFKEAHGVTGSGDDLHIENIINRASAWIELQTNRQFKARRYNGGSSNHSTTGVSDEDYIYFDGSTKDEDGDTIIDERGYGVFYLPQWPVQANSVLAFELAVLDERDSGLSGGEDWDTTDLVEHDDYIVDREEGRLIFLNGRFTPGFRNYRVTMAAGYAVRGEQPYVPDDLEQLCLDLAGNVYNDRRNLQSEKIGSWSRSFDTSKEDPLIANTLAKYTRTTL